MDANNYIYLKNKVERFQRLEMFKETLVDMQAALVRDKDITITVDSEGTDYMAMKEKLPFGLRIEEHDELFREIKDNLIDAIGMKIIEIEDKMKEL